MVFVGLFWLMAVPYFHADEYFPMCDSSPYANKSHDHIQGAFGKQRTESRNKRFRLFPCNVLNS